MDHSAEFSFRAFLRKVRAADRGFLSTKMSARWFFLDFYVYPALILLGVVVAFWSRDPWQWLTSAALVPGGVLVWTLAEYLIHRYGFHHAPVLKPMHMAHHDEPEGLQGSPTIVTVAVFAILAFLPARMVASLPSAAAWTAGVMIGYLAYISVHYLVHHRRAGQSRWMMRLMRAHAVHHHQTSCNFGVSTTLWDRVFGTLWRR